MNNAEYMNIITTATEYISTKIQTIPEIAIILGSGLGPLADEIENPTIIDYSQIPGFPVSTVKGHDGKLVFGTINGKYVIAMKGRFHYYEGNDMRLVTLPVRVFSKLGIKNILITNAAGGICETFNPGDIMIIRDHLSLLCPSVLRGGNLEEFGPRFIDMSEIYSKELISLAKEIAKEHSLDIKEGVYSFFPGPRYESPADVLGLMKLGSDATGMSTVPEAIVARHCGMTILGLSLITNKAAGLSKTNLSHAEVVETAKNSERKMVELVKDIIKKWSTD